MIEFSFHHREFVWEAFQPVDCLSIANVPSADHLLDLVGNQKLLEILWYRNRSLGDVKISNY